MIISRTPFRISFFGGGTDYPIFFRKHGGSVLSTTINKYCYIICRNLPPFFDYKFRLRYTLREETNTIEEIKHPSVKNCLAYLKYERGIEMVHTSDIPAKSGIASSSAFTVGFLHALHGLNGQIVTKRQLAREAIKVEQELIKENVGSQDQVACAFGGINKIDFSGIREFYVTPMTISNGTLEKLQGNLMLFFTGLTRFASDIALAQIKNTNQKTTDLHNMLEIVEEAIQLLTSTSNSLDDFGKLLHETWKIKKGLSNLITTNAIEEIYNKGIRGGALGGKLLGAGGGGFILFYVPFEYQENVKKELDPLLYVPFKFENLGSQIIHYSTQDFF